MFYLAVWGDREHVPSRLLPLGEEQDCALVSWGSALLGEIAAWDRTHSCPGRDGEEERRRAGTGSGSAAV